MYAGKYRLCVFTNLNELFLSDCCARIALGARLSTQEAHASLQIHVLTDTPATFAQSNTYILPADTHRCDPMLPCTPKAEPTRLRLRLGVRLPALLTLCTLWCTHLHPLRLRDTPWVRRALCSAQRAPEPWRHFPPGSGGSLRPAATGTMSILGRAAAALERQPSAASPRAGRGLEMKGASTGLKRASTPGRCRRRRCETRGPCPPARGWAGRARPPLSLPRRQRQQS